MKKYSIKKFLSAILIGIFALQINVYADVEKLNIGQIIQQGNDVYLYVDALDSTGRPSGETLDANQLSIKIEEGKAISAMDAASCQTLGKGCSYIFCIDISKSVKKEEMQEIKDSMTAFVNGMSANDYVRIITIGSEITSVCDSTQDKNALNSAIQGIERNADYTYLYKGLSFAMDGQRKRRENIPERAAIILFTDGMDDSDGAYTASQVMDDFSATQIPIYVVGLKGQDSKANLNSVGQIAQQSGGNIYSYSDMGITEAVQNIGNIMQNSCQVHVQPAQNEFGKKNLSWNVTYASGDYSVSSKPYTYSLSMENVVVPTAKPSAKPTATPEPTTAPTPTPEPEKTAMEKITGFLQENLVLCIATGMIVIALAIILVIILKRKNRFETEELPQNSDNSDSFYDETLPGDGSYEKTLPIDPYDDEKTLSEDTMGTTIEFEITFEGHTEKVVQKLVDELILGRGKDCNVDVVLNSLSESRKYTSRKHAVIIDSPEGIYVKNNSQNKTYLNGVEVIGQMVLCDGDTLQLGEASVKIKISC